MSGRTSLVIRGVVALGLVGLFVFQLCAWSRDRQLSIVMSELDALREVEDLPSRSDVLAGYQSVSSPPRPSFRTVMWPTDLPGYAWDYAWQDRNGLAATQAIVYARSKDLERPSVDWASDPHVDLLMLTPKWNYFSPGMEQLGKVIVEFLDWQPGQSVLDVGAGPGAPGFGLARQMRERGLPTDRLYLEDVNPGFLRFWRYGMKRLGWSEGHPIVPVLGATDDVRVPAGSVDKALIAHVMYWLLDGVSDPSTPFSPTRYDDEKVRQRAERWFASIDRALKPGGRIYLVSERWAHSPEQIEDHVRRVLGYHQYVVEEVTVIQDVYRDTRRQQVGTVIRKPIEQ